MAEFLCPYCQEYHKEADCEIKCGSDSPCRLGGIKGSRLLPGTNISINNLIDRSSRAKCKRCIGTPIKYLCPTTGSEIPRQLFENSKSLPLALVGGKGSGKSIYIAVLIHEIQKRMLEPFNCSLMLASCPESFEFYRKNYEIPLFENKQTIKATDIGEQTAMVFPVDFLKKKGRGVDKTVPLTLFDSAGENFQKTDIIEMNATNRYIARSKGIIMLIDPFKLPKVRETAQKHGVTIIDKGADVDSANHLEAPQDILQSVINLIRNITRKRKGLLNIPIAVVLTKADIFERFDLLDDDSALRSESGYLDRGAFIENERSAISREIMTLLSTGLEDIVGEQIKKLVEGNFKNYSFFAVTALGAMPEGDDQDEVRTVRSRRVLDPLLWLLSVNNYIKTDKL